MNDHPFPWKTDSLSWNIIYDANGDVVCEPSSRSASETILKISNDVGCKILLMLAKRRRWAYRDYLNMKKEFHYYSMSNWDSSLKENLLISLAVWVEAKNAYLVARKIYEKDARSRRLCPRYKMG